MKIKSFVLIVLGLSLTTTAMSQNTNLRGWEKGPLTWNDFTLMNESVGDEHSYLEYILQVEQRPDEINGKEMETKTAVLYVDRKMSWVDSHYRTPQELKYNQVAFNLAELHRRRLQLVIDTGGAVNMNYYTQLLSYMVDSFCHDTYYGADTAAVAWWEQDIRRQMDSITPIMVERHITANAIEKIIPQYRMLFNLGGGAKFYHGDLHDLFAPSGGFYFDFEAGLWRHELLMGMYAGGGRCRPDSIVAVYSYNTLYNYDDISTLDLHIDYGFIAIDSRKWSVMPFVGYGMQAVLYNEGDGTSSNGPSEGCWRAGIDVKYHLGIGDIYMDNYLEQFLFSAHGRVYVSFDRFKSIVGTPQGFTINAQLGFSFGMKQSKIRRAVKEGKL